MFDAVSCGMAAIGFSDSSPSEVISSNQELLSIACVFPLVADGATQQLPVGEYKEARRANGKVAGAQALASWLASSDPEYVRLTGMVNVVSQEQAARHGLRLIEELPKTYCLLYTSPSPRDRTRSRMPSSA